MTDVPYAWAIASKCEIYVVSSCLDQNVFLQSNLALISRVHRGNTACPHLFSQKGLRPAVACWLERRIRVRKEEFEHEFVSPLTHTLLKVLDAQ